VSGELTSGVLLKLHVSMGLTDIERSGDSWWITRSVKGVVPSVPSGVWLSIVTNMPTIGESADKRTSLKGGSLPYREGVLDASCFGSSTLIWEFSADVIGLAS